MVSTKRDDVTAWSVPYPLYDRCKCAYRPLPRVKPLSVGVYSVPYPVMQPFPICRKLGTQLGTNVLRQSFHSIGLDPLDTIQEPWQVH